MIERSDCRMCFIRIILAPVPQTTRAGATPMDDDDNHEPNRIPTSERIINVLYASVIIGFGIVGPTTGGLPLPGKRAGVANGVTLQGLPAGIMYAAMFCACVVLLSVVDDHCDTRNNEAGYRRIAQIGKFLGWSLFFLSLALYAAGIGS